MDGERIASAAPFSVGQRVRVVRPGYRFDGLLTTVLSVTAVHPDMIEVVGEWLIDFDAPGFDDPVSLPAECFVEVVELPPSASLIVGIDVGLRGALAFWDGSKMEIIDMPVLAVRKSGKVRNELDGYALARIIDAKGHIDHAAVELVGAMPTDGAIQAFAFGKAFGEVVGILRAHFTPITFVSPRTWRKAMGVPASVKGDKHPSIARATALLPACSGLWAAVRGNGDAHIRGGRAESALIALYGAKVGT